LISSNYSRIQCIGQEKWSKPVPACSLADCGIPPNPDNGKCTVTGTTYGHKKMCSCNCGYVLRNRDSATMTCHIKNSRANWGNPKPSCRRIMCEDLKKTGLQNGQVLSDGRHFGTTTEYTCNEGYELIGAKRRKCQGNEKWSGANPTCRLRMCDTLAMPNHGYLSPPDFNRTSGSIVHYICYAGYELVNGSGYRTCLESYQWSGKQPFCQSKNR
jgi:CUB/sushi domain-containing protein